MEGVELLMDVSLRRAQRMARALAMLLTVALPLALWFGGAQPMAVGLFTSPWDKLAHITVYAVLACAIGCASGQRSLSAMAIGFAGALLVGLLDEAHQMRLPGRSADIEDLVADAVGAALGTTVLAVLALFAVRIRLRESAASRTAP
jgi:VanZ family protein